MKSHRYVTAIVLFLNISVVSLVMAICITVYAESENRSAVIHKVSEAELQKAIDDLKSESEAVRYDAVDVLAQSNDPQVVPYLIDVVKNDSGDMRIKAVQALGESRDPRAVNVLMEALNDDYWVMQDEAVRALGQIKSRRAVSLLIDKLDTADSSLKQEAAWALGEIGNSTAADELITALADPEISRDAAVALLKIGEPASEVLIRALKNENVESRKWSACILGKMKITEAAPSLVILLSDNDIEVRCSARYALNKINDASVVPLLVAELDNPVSKNYAHDILAQLGRRAAPQLIQLLHDTRYSIYARQILASMAPLVFDDLIAQLSPANPVVNTCIVDIFVRSGDTIVPFLVKEVDNEDPFVRVHIIEALGEIRAPQALEALMQAVYDHNHTVRVYAAAALGKLGDPRAIPVLQDALNDEYWVIRFKAASALGSIDQPSAVQPLIEALRDYDVRVTDEASWGLSQITGIRLGRDYNAWRDWARNESNDAPIPSNY